MATDYNRYIGSTGTHYISNSGSDERGRYKDGTAGDQTGKEWQLKAWYNRPWTVVLRHPDATVRRMIAEFGIDAALNNVIGYDQNQRTSYWTALKVAGYKPANVKTPCEADCTAGVAANVKAIGCLLGLPELKNISEWTYSGNMKEHFTKAGFKALTESKYLTGYGYLLPGDILLYENHHAATNITKGKYASDKDVGGSASQPGTLGKGVTGSPVTAMQKLLLKWDAKCLPKYGADGDFGTETQAAVKSFQKAAGLAVTGVYDSATAEALRAAVGQHVEITGDSVNVRSAPNTNGAVLGVVKKGTKLEYQGEKSKDGWYLVIYKNQNAWVSGKFSKLVE